MSLDQILDDVVNLITIQIPIYFIPYFLLFYSFFHAFYEKISVNMMYIINSLDESFRMKYMGFFTLSDSICIPYILTSKSKVTVEPDWIYEFVNNTFIHSEFGHHIQHKRLPFIGASLAYVDETKMINMGDLSEWIMEQNISAQDGLVPLKVLVAAWKYCVDETLLFNFENMYLTVITEEGDEHVYNVDTSELVIDTKDLLSEEKPETKLELETETETELHEETKKDA
jgi:hypothetical protein